MDLPIATEFGEYQRRENPPTSNNGLGNNRDRGISDFISIEDVCAEFQYIAISTPQGRRRGKCWVVFVEYGEIL